MKAIGFYQYGSAKELQEINLPVPKPASQQVVVKLKATSINPIDWKLRQGYLKQMFNWDFPIVVGWDAAGIITEIGSEVTDWQVGDEVLARPDTTSRGTYAEYTLIDQNLLARKPQNVSFEAAAAVPLAGLTAWQALFEAGKLHAGQKVLIQAGAGGVGSYAIQFAKNCGAEVWTTASANHREMLQKLGANQVIDYHQPDELARLQDFDLIFDTLGGKNQITAFEWLKTGGKQISIAGEATPSAQIAAKNQQEFKSIWLRPDGQQLQKIANLMEKGIVESQIGKILSFSKENLITAHELSETNHVTGKIVISFN
ncbi:MAG: NADP-dependent oxidoreductase [Liquorilactobacillus nagelii]|jgi:NADPH:quinone reductase-like Zn-dependent oxidoreductase|uniref:NADPH:quinone reductase n=1 Tax=Liquorilactobacillus nagelii TaxID=82688 RepID=A0A3Q8CP18_9LACO|nr:NADP-dependent oxidoreductase [Liquorilactobacillus nagelii]AUJ32097.1 NADPH:quinone reductase [Liquorilactobacillus nagelii]MCC7615257.1 NADPH:quinone reductase [Liquorilactobacillus nagelii]MCP9315494.1 NADP-dependent oxidoreductase [Liquorilactobacillus nagelii]